MRLLWDTGDTGTAHSFGMFFLCIVLPPAPDADNLEHGPFRRGIEDHVLPFPFPFKLFKFKFLKLKRYAFTAFFATG